MPFKCSVRIPFNLIPFRRPLLSIKIFFSRVINLLLTSLARDRTGRISALGLFCTDLAALGPYCQDLGPIFSQYGPRAWLIRCMYLSTCKKLSCSKNSTQRKKISNQRIRPILRRTTYWLLEADPALNKQSILKMKLKKYRYVSLSQIPVNLL